MKKRFDGLVSIGWQIVYNKGAQIEISNLDGQKICIAISPEEDAEFCRICFESVMGKGYGSVDPFSPEIISEKNFVVFLINTLEKIELQKFGDQPSVKFERIIIQWDDCEKICAMLIDTHGYQCKISVVLALFIQACKPKIELFAREDLFKKC